MMAETSVALRSRSAAKFFQVTLGEAMTRIAEMKERFAR